MNQDQTLSPWQEQMPGEPLVPTTGEEFASLLEFDFDFSALENAASQPGNNNALQSSAPQVSTTMQDVGFTSMDVQSTSQPQSYTPIFQQMPTMEMQQQQQQQQQQQHQHFFAHKQQQAILSQSYGHGRPFIPPTPNSVEFHGGTSNGMAQLDTQVHRNYEQYSGSNDDQGTFTPLVSPAMTPLEQQFRMSDYTIPGEYFTPITSPALEASNANGTSFMFNQTTQAEAGFASSPIDMSHQFPAASAPSSPGVVRRQRRKPSISSRAPGRLVRQSPSVRPMSKRKSQLGSGVHSDDHHPITQDQSMNLLSVNPGDASRQPSSNESSGQDSVSPEPLSEPLMPPPALPRSTRSPYIAGHESMSNTKAAEAATPATLMKLRNQRSAESPQPRFSGSGSIIINEMPDEVMEDILLPEAANTAPANFTNGTVVPSGEQTPTLSANRTPTLKPSRGSSDRMATSSVGPSPVIGTMASPSGALGASKRSESKIGGRVSKKRQSVGSAQMSPALRPKISPSIQPLVRTDGISPETSALYLASKSNYQHILEGTLLPGVTYPENLAENLSSKRTNHKLAEQGRRNRINSALKEIEGLLPPALCKIHEKEISGDASKPEKPNSNQSISKASTVEMAIIYIKSLQTELLDTKEKLKIAESKLAGSVSTEKSPKNVNGNAETGETAKADTEEKDEETVHDTKITE
ncbi:hypothetical protein AJ80_08923 [Polytolypa hystricis UAMH7299]|uniref:BHLH domain-containing protein n=1 Tax=Polytolypa hystricis (strain UAMH7299) TaxID=1447883 RepID=A0A2B7WZI2_POLH7|nr:hypothetical protein AJ80_08923 [Polytolypa hystricis UAMH7299]